MTVAVKALPGIVRLSWPGGIIVDLSSFRRNRDRDLSAIATIRGPIGDRLAEIHEGRVNLVSGRSQQETVRILAERYEANWLQIVPTMCSLGRKQYEKGEDTVPVRYRNDMEPPRYLVYPMLALNKPNILYGLGSSGKSVLAVAVALLVATKYQDNPLKFAPYQQGNVLYADYEADRDEIEWRTNCIMRGMGIPEGVFELPDTGAIDYRHMTIPLADDMEELNRLVMEREYKLIVVDSIGASVGGDLNVTEGPNRLFPALRQLGCTTLLIGHVAKNAEGRTTPYGNAYFFNYARSIWELKKVQEAGEDNLALGLFHRKANSSKLHKKIGFEMTFEDDSIYFERAELDKLAGFEAELSIGERILRYLDDGKKASEKDIAEAIDQNKGTVHATLYRLRDRGKVVKMGDVWGRLCSATVAPQ